MDVSQAPRSMQEVCKSIITKSPHLEMDSSHEDNKTYKRKINGETEIRMVTGNLSETG